MKRGCSHKVDEIAGAIEAICEVEAVVTDLPAVEAGLTLLRAGGDFSDRVNAHQGEAFGGNVFASFDRSAIARLKRNGVAAADVTELTDAGR